MRPPNLTKREQLHGVFEPKHLTQQDVTTTVVALPRHYVYTSNTLPYARAHRHVRPHADSDKRIQLAPFFALHCRCHGPGHRQWLVARRVQADACYLVLKMGMRFLHQLRNCKKEQRRRDENGGACATESRVGSKYGAVM